MTAVVTIDDCREAGYCVPGVRRRCRDLGLDFKRLVRGGLPLSEVEQMDDAMVQKIIVKTKERIERDG